MDSNCVSEVGSTEVNTLEDFLSIIRLMTYSESQNTRQSVRLGDSSQFIYMMFKLL